MPTLDRITRSPDTMGGKACIRGMRVTVGMIVGQIGARRSIDGDVARALRQATTELAEGALVTVEPGRERLTLPLLRPT